MRRVDASLREQQIRKLNSSHAVPQIDQVAIERAVRVAVDRERATWQQELEQGKAHFRHSEFGVDGRTILRET
jgi:hypothetical protein